MQHYEELLERYRDISQIGHAVQVLSWDQNTYMPSGAVNMRGDQQALLSGYGHSMIVSPRIGELIRLIKDEGIEDPEKGAIVREIERSHRRETSIPERLVKEMSRLEPVATENWVKARQKSDFSIFSPSLKEVFRIKMEFI